MKVLLAHPHGFCAGVVMAIRSLERALELLGPPIFVYHEIVHNQHIVRRFRNRGVIFVEDIEDVPVGANLLYSAHGVSPLVRRDADDLGLYVIDATCPLVSKVHLEARKFASEDYTIILIGHEGHDEVVGVVGEAPDRIILVENEEAVENITVPDGRPIAYLTQTTLSQDEAIRIIGALKRRFPTIQGPNKEDICYATQNRQEALRELAGAADCVLVVGSHNSSNANRLVEVARECGSRAHLIDSAADIQLEWLDGVETLALSAGASTPEDLVQQCVEWLGERYEIELVDREIRHEDVSFPLPKALRAMESARPAVTDPRLQLPVC